VYWGGGGGADNKMALREVRCKDLDAGISGMIAVVGIGSIRSVEFLDRISDYRHLFLKMQSSSSG
jgi:hypothetical protein